MALYATYFQSSLLPLPIDGWFALSIIDTCGVITPYYQHWLHYGDFLFLFLGTRIGCPGCPWLLYTSTPRTDTFMGLWLAVPQTVLLPLLSNDTLLFLYMFNTTLDHIYICLLQPVQCIHPWRSDYSQNALGLQDAAICFTLGFILSFSLLWLLPLSSRILNTTTCCFECCNVLLICVCMNMNSTMPCVYKWNHYCTWIYSILYVVFDHVNKTCLCFITTP